MVETVSESQDVAAFVERFDAAWRGGAEGLRAFERHVTPDVLLVQPLLPTSRGVDAFRAQFDGVFAAMPDLRGEVLAWGATDAGVLIDLALHGTLGRRPVELVTCDRIVLRDGLMAERHARMDVLPLIRASMANPLASWPLLRSLGRARAPCAAGACTPRSRPASCAASSARSA